MINIQLDLFEPYDEIAEIKKELWKTKKLAQNVQRGVFSRLDKTIKHHESHYEELEKLRFELERLKFEIKKLGGRG